MLYALVISLALLATGVVWQVETRFRLVLTPMLLFMIYYVLRIVPGFVYGIEVKKIGGAYAYAVVSIVLLAAILGWATARLMWPSGGRELLSWHNTSVQRDRPVASIWVVCLAVGLLFVGLLLYRGIPPSFRPFFVLVQGGDWTEVIGAVSEGRRLLTKGHFFGGDYRGQGVMREVLFVGWSLVSCYALARFMRLRSFRSLLVLLGSVTTSYILVSGDGTRGPFLLVFISMVATWTMACRVPPQTLALVGIVFITLGVGLGAYTPKMHGVIRSEGVGAAVGAFVERVAIGNSFNDVLAVDAVRSRQWEYGLGRWHSRDILAAFPGTLGGKPLGYYLHLTESAGATGTTYLTGTQIMTAHTDFGIWGLGVPFLIMGFVAAIGLRTITNARKTESALALAGVSVMLLGQLYTSGLIGVAVELGVLALLAAPLFGVRHFPSLARVQSPSPISNVGLDGSYPPNRPISKG